MKISWMGHSCFLLECAGATKIITDPYESGSYDGKLGYAPVGVTADIVTVSHQHPDHNYIKEAGPAKVLNRTGRFSVKEVDIEGVLSYHDEQRGSLRGENIIFIIKAEGLKIIHFGDLGTPSIDGKAFAGADIVFLPVGGTFTIDAAKAKDVLRKVDPRICIPMHFKTERLGFDIEGTEKFLEGSAYQTLDTLEIDTASANDFEKIVLLRHQR